MKREHLLIAAAAIFALSSCTKEETAVEATSLPVISTDVINFTTNTTRAETIDLGDIEDGGIGFEVFALYPNSETGEEDWLINSDYYKYSSDEWVWTTSDHTWPTSTDEYPVVFYAVYAADLDGVTTTASTDLTDADTTPVTISIEIAEPDDQIDLLASVTSTATKPSDGKLSLSLDHILTKIDFGIIPGSGKKVYLNVFQFNNLEDKGDYDMDAADWTVTSTDGDAEYPLTDFTAVNGVKGDETTAISFTSTSDEYSLMLLPQPTTTWAASSWDGESAIDDTYIEMNYRATYYTGTDDDGDEVYEDYIGYTYAKDHPDYDETNEDHIEYSDTPLFVKVGYPLIATWTSSYNYTYNIKIGTEDATNGYLLDDVYYDDKGEETPFEIDFDKEPGELISDGNIHFNVSVSDWGENSTSTIL